MSQNFNQHPIIHLLKEASSLGIDYVSWKNNHEIELALDGKSDLDLLIDISSIERFADLLENHSWIEFLSPVANYKFIKHYYHLSESGCVRHLHIYYRLQTGDSRTKEFIFPASDRIYRTDNVGLLDLVRRPSPESQLGLFKIRHMIKNSSILGRINYERNWEDYQAELNMILLQFEREPASDELSILGQNISDNLVFQGGKLVKTGFVDCWKFKKELKEFRRFSHFRELLFKLHHIINVQYFAKLRNFKKVLPGRGLSIAFCGIDGSGKSSLSQMLYNTVKNDFSVKYYHLGKPLPKSFYMLMSVFKSSIRAVNLSRKGSIGTKRSSSKKLNSPRSNLAAVLVGYFRYRQSKRVEKWVKRGFIVITDRWPSSVDESMDGPSIIRDSTLSSLLQKTERYFYNKIKRNDICIMVDVELSVALSRNHERSESDDEDGLVSRFNGLSRYKPITNMIVRFDNSFTFEESKPRIYSTFWKLVANRAK